MSIQMVIFQVIRTSTHLLLSFGRRTIVSRANENMIDRKYVMRVRHSRILDNLRNFKMQAINAESCPFVWISLTRMLPYLR